MNSNELFIEAAHLKDQLRSTIYHPYLYNYIEPPHIDDDMLLLLCSLTEEKDDEIRKEVILSTMLVQIALDIHDRILLIDLTSDTHKTRQLTVLAGDYYSSLYYERLSSINERHLIHLLAMGIKEVNELKTLFLYDERLNLEQLLSIQRKLDSCILNQFSIAEAKQPLSPIIREFFLLKRLIREKNKEEEGQVSLWIHLFGRQLERYQLNKKSIDLLPQALHEKTLETIDSLLIASYNRIESMLTDVDNTFIHSIIENQLSFFKQLSANTNKLLPGER